MNIEDYIRESEQKFEQVKSDREQHLQQAEELFVEMTKLQGEFRLLQRLLAEQEKNDAVPSQDANTVTAKPEKEKK